MRRNASRPKASRFKDSGAETRESSTASAPALSTARKYLSILARWPAVSSAAVRHGTPIRGREKTCWSMNAAIVASGNTTSNTRASTESRTGLTGCGKKRFRCHSRAKRGIRFFRKAEQNSRFLGQTPPVGMTGRHFFRSLLSLLGFGNSGPRSSDRTKSLCGKRGATEALLSCRCRGRRRCRRCGNIFAAKQFDDIEI